MPPIVHEVLRSPGQPLDEATRAFMEPRFGHDLSRVRVHTNAKAAESARAVNALAYTVGRDVVFGSGQFAPGTVAGQRLLAHELTHVVQQNVDGVQKQLVLGHAGDVYEQEADRMALQAHESSQSLDPATRALMEPRFGHDFSRVRIHTDARAAEPAQAVNTLAYTDGTDWGILIPDARCKMGGPCPEDPLADYQGSGETRCDTTTGTMTTTLTEHCAGDCVAQHEAVHRGDRGECCRRVKLCLDTAGGNAAREAACHATFNTWYPKLSKWTECNAYTTEVACLTAFINNNCNGSRRATTGAVIGGLAGGILGGIGGFLVGGPVGAAVGAIGGAAAGAGIGYLAGRVSTECCNTLRDELAFATGERATRCAGAVNEPCPFRADGTII